MFTKALEEAVGYTRPLAISTKTISGKVNTSCGTYIILNDEGWIMTAAHILIPMLQYQQHKLEMSTYQAELEKINKSQLSEKQKKQRIKQLKKNNNWITNISYWWGDDTTKINGLQHKQNLENDIAVGKIENFNKSKVKSFPKIINPKKIQMGRNLCKLGFPFPEITPSFKEGVGFNLEGNLSYFPLDGIFTRSIKNEEPKKGIIGSFIETSTPGLKGQSGGPWVDKNGNIWAIQSQTSSYNLDFIAPAKRGNKIVEENQFLNVGIGVHPQVIVDFLTEKGIKFEIAT